MKFVFNRYGGFDYYSGDFILCYDGINEYFGPQGGQFTVELRRKRPKNYKNWVKVTPLSYNIMIKGYHRYVYKEVFSYLNEFGGGEPVWVQITE